MSAAAPMAGRAMIENMINPNGNRPKPDPEKSSTTA